MKQQVGIAGAGSMGSGIAQVAATNGNIVTLFDTNIEALQKAKASIRSSLDKLVEKNKIEKTLSDSIFSQITFTDNLNELKSSDLFIEAVIENIEIKQSLFKSVESIVSDKCILATNTSSLPVIAIGSTCNQQDRIIGLHFFNPPVLMQLVEVIPSFNTSEKVLTNSVEIIRQWSKTPVIAKDTPGFIVNRIARPYYGEALRIYEEGIADFATIDHAMKTIGGFKMGPFELMDFIGNDVNFKVTETVFTQMFFDPRYKPSITQKRLYEGKLYGRKSNRGYYDYKNNIQPKPSLDNNLHSQIFDRIFAMLVNEAADALMMGIATAVDIETAMTKGVNYPQGLLTWANKRGLRAVYNKMEELFAYYGEDRYRVCPLLRKLALNDEMFRI
ncbi:MAG TPA: 3-hydroxyacyl-CoA dehydrogenase NAD-binding domain-containing protein [Bacteroidia bacterium]|nr:3-hydroxybutyryl-CoA dehydrogenase [Bacteroidia bacterium]MBP7715053.1 3-hydroxybutyryl-CoA dehydrogenase [Bacteroidia bacterium]MBP8669510.1 3-hydroxybutyryl-CoA dehydrogenase [Bacteroidia bacterium]HOZ81726.1 3-hydroxyacyl-CoA dehydrogenase NAD-binding domain-containing protein [Bacteroidia bacterium]HQW18441.1 3-hydroxyacyl-CoA dehydrogenase NAD-binding domain-containing protein [Bacteroidia bacterium]